MEPELLPPSKHDLLEVTFTGFPKTPGAIVCNFGGFICYKYSFIIKLPGGYHSACQADASAASSGNDIVVMRIQINIR